MAGAFQPLLKFICVLWRRPSKLSLWEPPQKRTAAPKSCGHSRDLPIPGVFRGKGRRYV